MATEFKIKWDQSGEKCYETGVDRAVMYPKVGGAYPKGYGWNGLTSVSESPSGAEATALYANNKKYMNLMSAEEFGGSIGAYMYPDEFNACIGYSEPVPGMYVTQQNRTPFGLTFRTLIGNDESGTDYGYKLHMVYDALVSPSEKENNSVNESPEAAELSWEFTTTPVDYPGMKPTAHLVIDSTKFKENPEALAALEVVLYGSGETDARLPLPAEVAEILSQTAAG